MNDAVTIRYFAVAREAAGAPEESITPGTLGDICEHIAAAHGTRLEKVLEASMILVNGVREDNRSAVVPSGSVVDVLPPFAGG